MPAPQDTNPHTHPVQVHRAPVLLDHRIPIVASWISCLLMVGFFLPSLSVITSTLDETLLAYAASRAAAGEPLYRDTFYYLPPIFGYWQTLLVSLFGNTLISARVGSLVAISLSGVLVNIIVRRAWGTNGQYIGLMSQSIFYLFPYWGDILIGVPNALAMVCTLAALAVVTTPKITLRWLGAAGILLAISLALKPIFAAAMWVPLVVIWPQHKVRGVLVIGAASVLTLATVLGIETWLHGPAFWDTILMQFERFTTGSNYGLVVDRNALGDLWYANAERPPRFEWNLEKLAEAYRGEGPFVNPKISYFIQNAINVLVACGLAFAVVAKRMHRIPLALATVELLTATIFGVLVWDPLWHHYLIIIAPATALLAGFSLGWLRKFPVALASIALLTAIIAPPLAAQVPKLDHKRPERIREIIRLHGQASIISLNPEINFLLNKPAPCDFDPSAYIYQLVMHDRVSNHPRLVAASPTMPDLTECVANLAHKAIWLDAYTVIFAYKSDEWQHLIKQFDRKERIVDVPPELYPLLRRQ